MTEDVPLDDLPPELADRVRAAAAHADYRSIHHHDDGYLVYAHSGDRVVIMDLALAPNNSVAETTETLLASAIVGATAGDDEGVLEVVDGGRRRRLAVPAGLARRLG
ncbi:MAG: hypothetical protein M3P53_03830 [Actinomycetota bacterium]|nr:hypothetical protein [Actinomycetota bacterium]